MLVDYLHDLFDALDDIEFYSAVFSEDLHESLKLISATKPVQELTRLLQINPQLQCAVVERIRVVRSRPFSAEVEDVAVLALLAVLHGAGLDLSEAAALTSPDVKLSHEYLAQLLVEPQPKVSPYATMKLPTSQGGEIEVGPRINEIMATVGAVPDWTPDLLARIEMAQAKYGQPLLTRDGRDTLIDLLQELYDANNYLCKDILERDPRLLPALPEVLSALVSLTSCIYKALALPK